LGLQLKKEESIFLVTQNAEAKLEFGSFGGIELQNHDHGYFVHIDHSKGTDFGPNPLPQKLQQKDSKVNIVELHRHCNSSAIVYTKEYTIINNNVSKL
jgi:hypothetical protein